MRRFSSSAPTEHGRVVDQLQMEEHLSMDPKKIILGIAGYTIGTFALAVVWHVSLFGDQYRAFGFLEGEPNFLLGLLTILLQGVILSALFPRVSLSGGSLRRAMKFVAIIGVFFWTSHVLAFVAKQTVQGVGLFVVMETIYLVLQFGLFGFLIGLIYRSDDTPLGFYQVRR